MFDWLSYNFKIRLCCFFLIGFLENGRCEGKNGRVIKRKKKKKMWSGIFKKKNEINCGILNVIFFICYVEW
jgi:hypothetical protein